MCTYRIKIVTKKSGDILYYPQKRIFNLGLFSIWTTLYEKDKEWGLRLFKAECYTITAAKECIDEYIEDSKKEKTKKVEYIVNC